MDLSQIMNMFGNPQAMRAQMEAMRAKQESLTAVGTAGAGMIKITLNGAMKMLSCEIAPEFIDPKDPQMLQDLIRAAFNDASQKIQEQLQANMLGGMNLPPELAGMFGGKGQ